MIPFKKGNRVAIIYNGIKLAEAKILEAVWDEGVALCQVIQRTGPFAKRRQHRVAVCWDFLAHVV